MELFGKLEAFNPGGSVKDRIGVAMIEAAEREGLIEPGRTHDRRGDVGNTGIALAFVCAAKGYDLRIFLPQGMSREREALLRHVRREVEVVESLGGMNEAVDAARALAASRTTSCPTSSRTRPTRRPTARGTGPEILDALDGKVDVLRRRRRHRRHDHGRRRGDQGAQPQGARDRGRAAVESPVLSGGAPGPHRIQGIGAGFVPPVLNREMLDEIIPVPDEAAIETARLAARARACSAGMSCGAALWAAMQVAARPESKGKRIVCVLPDSGERYISAPFFAPQG